MMSKPGTPFQPTDLDRALERDPATEVGGRALLAASQKKAPPVASHPDPTVEQSQPDSAFGQANREGQRETAAASLAGGMIAAEGRPVTAAEAVEKVKEVMEELNRQE